MAAEIIEQEDLETGPTDDLPITDELTPEQLITEFSEPDTLAPEPAPEDVLPDKYQGKSIKDIVSMHQEAEKLIGKHSSEVGELRSMVDGYIKTNLLDNSQPAAEPEPEIDFFEDPQAAVSKAIETHPAVVASQQAAQQQQHVTALTSLQAKHPDMKDVLQNQNFIQWVQGSPVRQELFQRADKNYDFNCADELITLFKERNQVAQETLQTETTARQQQVKAAQTGSGSGVNTAGAKRVYRRADIIKLMKNDPDRYEALSGEIMEAYRTGRVR
jgi:hypothetical protein